MENTDLGKKIASLRKEKGWTQETLALALGVSNQAVSKWESGTCCPDVLLLPKLADLFGITLDELFCRKPQYEHDQIYDQEDNEENSYTSQTVEKEIYVNDLPWEDDGKLRAVLFIGHNYQGHKETDFGSKRDSNDPYYHEKKTVEFHYTGKALDILSDFAVTICDGNVEGNVTAGDSVNCGLVGGDVTAGDSVICDNVLGHVTAGDSVNCGNVEGNVSGGDDINCADVSGSVTAGGDVNCGDIGGNVMASGTFSRNQ